MKIGIYLGWGALSPEAGGGYTFQQSLLNALFQAKSHHTFYIFYYGASPVLPAGATHVLCAPIEPIRYSRFMRLYLKLVKKKPINLLNKAVLDFGIDFMWFMTPGYEFVEVPYAYTVWDLQHRKQSFFPEVSVERNQFEGREALYASVIPRAAYVFTGNVTACKEVVDFYRIPQERVKMLEMPTPDFALQQRTIVPPVIKTKNPYLFYPAQFWPHKNHVMLLRALRYLKDVYDLNFDLVLTGSDKGNLSYIKEQTKNYGLSDRVHFMGFVSRDELVALYQHAFALVFPSFFGPNNIPPLEAFALGCPVICAAADGMQEQLGEAALFFDITQEDELVEKIRMLCNDESLRSTLVAAGKSRAAQWTAQDYVHEVMGIMDAFAPIRACWGDQRTWVRK